MIKVTYKNKENTVLHGYYAESGLTTAIKMLKNEGYEIISQAPATEEELAELMVVISKPEPIKFDILRALNGRFAGRHK